MNEKTRELLPQQVSYYTYPDSEDDISLVDVWIAISAYKKLFWSVFSTLLVTGIILVIFVFNEKYILTSAVQIGSVLKNEYLRSCFLTKSLIKSFANTDISSSFGYSFNKSHSLSYSYLAMQTLYLKHYHPTEFYTALLNHPKSGNKREQIEPTDQQQRQSLGYASDSSVRPTPDPSSR